MGMPIQLTCPRWVRGNDARPIDQRDAPQVGRHVAPRPPSGTQASLQTPASPHVRSDARRLVRLRC
jgi:hypothetical protein